MRLMTKPNSGACAYLRRSKLFIFRSDDGKEYPIGEKPQLPLPDCPFPRQCECHYIKLFDRRKGERRSGQELRAGGHRFEKDNPPRRSGKDRRKNVDWT